MATTPEQIGNYEVLRPLAQGGMAEVYEVRDPATGERMALKLLIETRSSIKRFNREFEALTRLNHPSIVRVYRYGYHARQPWITMELLDGEPLQSHIKRSGEPGETTRTDEVIRVGWLLANALQYVHDRGLVHRDLKSANVQVLLDGRVKIIDFGTAHLAHPLERITQEGDFVGTFSYAAPEQIVGAPVDHRADLYSLGVLLYRLATGRRPFKASDPQKVAQMHLRQVARPIRELVPELPEELERVIQWLMEKKKKDRPQSAEEVARALEEMAGHPLALPGQGMTLMQDRPIGRERELRDLWRWFLAQAEGSTAIVSGGDVAERHRLAAMLGNDAARRGWRGLVVSASDQPVRSLLAVVRSLLQGVPRPVAEQAAQWVTEVRTLQPAALASTLSALREGLRAALRDIDKRLLLVLEAFDQWDAQGVAAAQTLTDIFVAASAPISIVVTVADAAHPSVVALQRVTSATTRVHLEPLDVRGTALAVGELLHRRPPPLDVARRVHAESHGIPTLITSAVKRMVEQGELVVRSDDGNRIEWNPRNARAAALSPELRDQLDERVGHLPIALRRVLEALAVTGGTASRRTIAHAVGWDEPTLQQALQELVDRGLVYVDRKDHHITSRDPLLLDAIDESMHAGRRRVVQQLVVDTLPADGGGAALIRVLVAMGRNEAALRAGIRIGTDLLDRGAPADALELLDILRPLANHPGLDGLTRAELHLLYGRCVRAVRPLDPASVRALHTADGLVSDPATKARVQLGYAEVQGAIGHQANYHKHLMQAWELVMQRPESALSSETALLLAQNRFQEGDISQANLWLERAR
ncbi:MAG TPA: protein kinase, partial [Myxococcota bacterium]|nr:protein kinase [Myxococcota bacterium]